MNHVIFDLEVRMTWDLFLMPVLYDNYNGASDTR